jgi:hypothetical protein
MGKEKPDADCSLTATERFHLGVGKELELAARKGGTPSEVALFAGANLAFAEVAACTRKLHDMHPDFLRMEWLHGQTKHWGGVTLLINGVAVGTAASVRQVVDDAMKRDKPRF